MILIVKQQNRKRCLLAGLSLSLILGSQQSNATDTQSDLELQDQVAFDTHLYFAEATAEIPQRIQSEVQAAFTTPNADPLSKLSILVYGLSYHPDKQGVKDNKLDNERNWGLGVNYEFFEDARGVGFLEAGGYRDSGSNLAKYGGAGYQFKLGKSWRLGAMLVGVQSKTYFDGRFFIAPIPVLTYDFGYVKLNAIYIPSFKNYNQFAAFGLMFSIPFAE